MVQIGRWLNEIEPDAGSSYLEHQAKYGADAFPTYHEIDSVDEIHDEKNVATVLQGIDWSFTKDDTTFLTHDLHPYPAKFIPQIPGHCIARLSVPGDLVLDPFGGSGTAALEAVRMGRRAISIDANPVATLIGKVKTSNVDRTTARELHAIKNALATYLFELPDASELYLKHKECVPEIPNIDKWFPLTSRAELALIRSRIAKIACERARDIALLALSRIVLSVSFQDSETRYSSKPHEVPQGTAIRRFIAALDSILKNIATTQAVVRYGVCQFITADAMQLGAALVKPDSVDLIVSSPPYANANDYHLYHRFRLLWLGHDPRQLAKIEIGSHLRHQKNSSGFDSYLREMQQCLTGMFRVLRAGHYAVLVVGDAIYNKVLFPGAESLSGVAQDVGFDVVCIIERNIHRTKRSFVMPGRRATKEKLLVLKKPAHKVTAWFHSPPYKLWPYETLFRSREMQSILGLQIKVQNGESFSSEIDPYAVTKARRLVFTHALGRSFIDREPTWQAIIENGLAAPQGARKDPKYVTHGLHPYKGKFYPQLAKALLNISSLPSGASVFDPFCGSGTTLLEGYLNGLQTFGCDMNPLAAKIAKAKVGILSVNPDLVRDTLGTLANKIAEAPAMPQIQTDQFSDDCLAEIFKWFPKPVIYKLNWVLAAIRSVSEGVIRDFLEVVLSSILRDVSQQDPTDLRIRKRKTLIDDAPVFQMYCDALETQYERIQKFWGVRGYSPHRFRSSKVIESDSRNRASLVSLGLERASVDLVLTSPPYATALPYIDTDRLSLLILCGMNSVKRRPIENSLIGSREIGMKDRYYMENMIASGMNGLPHNLCKFLRVLQARLARAPVGFRRKNMPALLLRFFHDLALVIDNCCHALRPHGEAMIVIGDNRMRVDGEYERIPTTDFVQELATSSGLQLIERIDISVTTENLVHIKNAITQNVVLRLKKP